MLVVYFVVGRWFGVVEFVDILCGTLRCGCVLLFILVCGGVG